MQLKQGLKQQHADKRAVAPVIGVVLMVAIAVIIAAIVSTEVLAVGRNTAEVGPNTAVHFDYNPSGSGADSFGNDHSSDPAYGLLTISHEGGAEVEVDRLELKGASSITDAQFSAATPSIGGFFDTGDTITVWVKSDDTVRVVWDSRESSKTTSLATWEGS